MGTAENQNKLFMRMASKVRCTLRYLWILRNWLLVTQSSIDLLFRQSWFFLILINFIKLKPG